MFDLSDPTDPVVVACPNPPTEAVAAGKAIRVPGKEYDAAELIAQLPRGFRPDVVQLSARDPSYRPRNLAKFSCPTVLKLGDSFQWSDGSLSQMVAYAQDLQCDYHWTYQCAQHLHFFREAGLKNPFWLPGSLVLPPYFPAAPAPRRAGMVFRGSLHGVHGHRRFLLEELAKAGIPVDVARKEYDRCLDDYAAAAITFNCSANGDLNRRVFEAIFAGGFLLTDRLSPETGLPSLFREGEHFEAYGDEAELTEKARFYLAHPEKAAAIAERGRALMHERFRPETARQHFQRAVFDGQIDPVFRSGHDRRCEPGAAQPESQRLFRMKLYEAVQEIHALNPRIQALAWNVANERIVSDLVDLPRLSLLYQSPQPRIRAHLAELGMEARATAMGAPSDLVLVDQAAVPAEAVARVKAGGLLLAPLGASLAPEARSLLEPVMLVDAVTRSPLGEGQVGIFRRKGKGALCMERRTFTDFARGLLR
jgi:hypothetical protein